MHKKATATLTVIVILLIVLIGTGVWTLINRRQVQEPPHSKTEQTKLFRVDEIAQHNSKSDCWTVISGNVYDLTQYINRHPGGNEILRSCGTDATTLFKKRQTSDGQFVGTGAPHSQAAQEQLAPLKIGALAEDT